VFRGQRQKKSTWGESQCRLPGYARVPKGILQHPSPAWTIDHGYGVKVLERWAPVDGDDQAHETQFELRSCRSEVPDTKWTLSIAFLWHFHLFFFPLSLVCFYPSSGEKEGDPEGISRNRVGTRRKRNKLLGN
jgi:hypothetical protein